MEHHAARGGGRHASSPWTRSARATAWSAIKAKKKARSRRCGPPAPAGRVRVQLLGDYYPAGDEYDLVYEVTGRLIPPAGHPARRSAWWSANVETLVNVAAAAEGRPVTHKIVTIAGAVGEPATISVPLGTSLREAIALAGGATVPDPVLCVGGMMMGPHHRPTSTPRSPRPPAG